MKPAPFEYYRPQGLDDAVEALASRSDAKVLAGGQSLIPLLSMRLAAPSRLVDINGIPGLDYVRSSADGVRVGALARHADVLASPDAQRVQPLVGAALTHVGHAAIRNRGTTVGSLVHADAAAEMPLVLLLLGGCITVAGPRGRRVIPAGDLFLGPLESSVEHDEVAVEALFPALQPRHGVAFAEIARRQGDFALCGVAAVVEVDGERACSVRAGFLSMQDVPVVVDLSAHLAGLVLSDPDSPPALAAAAAHALTALDPAADLHASAAYRAQLARVLTARVVVAAFEDALLRMTAEPGCTLRGGEPPLAQAREKTKENT